MAKILCYRSWWMWDFVTTIPKRYQIKDNWDELFLLTWNNKYHNKLCYFSGFDKLPLDIWLAKEIVEIPYSKLKLLRFCIKNFRKFDKFYMPIKTKWWYLLWKILSKKAEYTFGNQWDDSKYKNIIEWEIWSSKLLSNYKEFFNSYIKWGNKINNKYICIYPSDKIRSLKNNDWINLVKYISSEYNYKIILVWWKREKRFSELIKNNFKEKYWKDIINKIWESDLKETMDLLNHSVCNVSCDGWIMRCWCILNENNLTIQIRQSTVYRPTEDWKQTINITKKKCKGLCDRECIFKWTDKENICKTIDIQEIYDKFLIINKNINR